MSNTPHYDNPQPTPDGLQLNDVDFARFLRVQDSQLNGGLGLTGAGAFAGWNATSGGAGVAISAGKGVALHSTKGFIYLETKSAQSVALPGDDGDYYLFAGAQIATTKGNADSRETALPLFIFGEDDTLDGAIRLAQIHKADGSSTITPDLQKGNFALLVARVAQLESDVGYDDAARAQGTVAERLSALNPTDGDTAILWNLLQRSAVDPTTIAQYVEAQIAAALTNGVSTVLPAQSRDEHAVNILNAMALHQMINNDAFSRVPPHLAFIASPGRGTGAWSFENLTDLALTTMPYDSVNHLFGQAG